MRGIELFAGAGGLGIGVSRAGFHPSLIVEWDRWCCDTLRENRIHPWPAIPTWPEPVEGDVRNVDFRPFEGTIDLVTGGPPCQPFSLGGKHRAYDDTRDMWPEAVRAIREARPRAFVFENVKGLTRQAFATYLGYVVLQLQHPSLAKKPNEDWRDHLSRLQSHHTRGGRIEYRVIYELLDAADYGVAQRRHRVVFVGFREDVGAGWSFPRATHSQASLLWDQGPRGTYWDQHKVAKRDRAVMPKATLRGGSMLIQPAELPWRTVRDAFEGLPDPEKKPVEAAGWFNHRFQPGARSYPGHTGSLVDEPAKALKAGVHGVPGGENMLRRADGSIRYFSVREAARLQAFPDTWKFHGSWSETMRQLGNAVPTNLGETVARSVREHLETSGAPARGSA